MDSRTFIFTGNSGSGKGTQAKLLQKYLLEKDADKSVYYLETGSLFREFFKGKDYTHDLAQEIYERGERQPGFLAIHMWSHALIRGMEEGGHLLVDGTPRSLNEAHIFDTAMEFYRRENPFVIYVNVPRAWSRKHLLARGREDDTREQVEKRLDWFEEDVMPAIEFFKEYSRYMFIEVNGDQTIEEVHKEILSKIEN
ncbi:MAG: adenylate kinase [Patescibacteria group bacterium]|nr:MAG: adenylate kinase [Patescibacteria group bacterium]